MIMAQKEDLGLSLSLNFPATAENNSSLLQLNRMPSLVSSSIFNRLHKSLNCTDSHQVNTSDRNNCNEFGVETRSFLKGIDVNRIPPAAGEAEDDAGVSSPNSTISSISGKRSERDVILDGHDADRDSSRGISDEDDGDNCRKKLRLSKDQSAVLEENFKEHNTLNPKQKLALAKRLGLRPRQVEVWFQNRRARTKLKQTEVDCEFLKRCCENLTDENRKLQKEIQELRALNLSPQFYMQMAPPTTLAMCSSCERVIIPPPSSSSGATLTAMIKPDNCNQNNHRKLPFRPRATMTAPDLLHRRS